MTVTSSLPETSRPDTRETRALELFRALGRRIERLDEDLYLVPSEDGLRAYRVDLGDETCTCPDARRHPDLNCKHLLAVGVKRAKRRGTTARRLVALEQRFDHELADDETRQEWRDQILRLRRRLGL